jgi:hypothetical protein
LASFIACPLLPENIYLFAPLIPYKRGLNQLGEINIMNRNYFGKNVLLKSAALGVALICCASTSYAESKKKEAAPAQSSEASSAITVKRKPSVGSGVDVDVTIDGKRVRTLIKGSTYRGTVSAGKHTISVAPKPNTTGQREEKMEFTAEKGQAVSFSVAHDKSGKLVLEKN